MKKKRTTIHRPINYSEMDGCELKGRHKNVKPIYPHR